MSVEQIKKWGHPWSGKAFKSARDDTTDTPPESGATSSSSTFSKACESDSADAPVYDVYGQEISTDNMMPKQANQLPSPGQRVPLSTERESSTIPKGGGAKTGETWTYPSAQMFWNALSRKGKADDVDEGDMGTVVAVHNAMNERTWGEVVQWEKRFHCEECTDPKLLRFRGRPDDLSPAARWRMWVFGYPRPFDRHDWVIDRCGKSSARYIIDYYYREDDASGDPIEIHVRPALDSISAAWDRVRSYGPPPTPDSDSDTTEDVKERPKVHVHGGSDVNANNNGNDMKDGEFEQLTTLTRERVDEISASLKKECSGLQAEMMKRCGPHGDQAKCNEAHIAITYCAARQVCPATADDFRRILESGSNEQAAYNDMEACVQRFALMANRVVMQSRSLGLKEAAAAAKE